MSTTIKGYAASSEARQPDAANGMRFAIVRTQWNATVVDALVNGAHETLKKRGADVIDVYTVPGCYELPFACQRVIAMEKYDAVLAIGVLVKGDTMHFEYIAETVSHGLSRIALDTTTPVIFGVLTCLNEEQARKRAGLVDEKAGGHNHGPDWADSAIEMVRFGRTRARFVRDGVRA